MPRLAEFVFELPDQLKKYVAADVKRDAKLMAAQGMLPLPPGDLVLILFAITKEDDEELETAATQSLVKMPENILKTICADVKIHPLILDFLARGLPPEAPLQEAVALNKSTHDETIVFQAGLPNKRLVDIISENQIRILRCPDIVDSLGENILAGHAQLERIIRFVEMETRRTGKDVPEKTPPPPEKAEQEEDEVPLAPEEAADDELGAVTMDEGEESPWAAMTFSDDLLKDHETETEEEEEEVEKSLYKQIQDMKISEKIKLALRGGGSARALLIKDSNKLVAAAVLKSPRITDSEIESISKSRGVAEDVIRAVASSREWTRSYGIKMNLVQNPKTPTPDAMRFLNFLRDKDLRDISRSKNVPNNIAAQAKRLLARKEEKARPGGKKH